MHTISSVFKVALAVPRRTCVTEDDESRCGSSIKHLINDRQATDRTEFIVRAGNIKENCTQDS